MAILSIEKENDKNWAFKELFIAKYNMNLDNGTFIKGHIYEGLKKSDNPLFYLVTTEEGKQQKLMDLDFIALFDYLKN